jgi:TolB protein
MIRSKTNGSCVLLATLVLCVGQLQAQEKPKPIYYYNPDWSRDGSKILFESTRDGKYALYIINVDGTALHRITDLTSDNGQARWSKDNKQIVFYSGRDGHLQLYIMNADGSEQRRLANDDDVDYLPDLSPNRDQVVYVSHPQTQRVDADAIYLIRTDGTGKTRLTVPGTSNNSPRWSPNGKQILFRQGVILDYKKMTREEVTQARNADEIWVMNKDGSGRTNLTKNTVRDFGAHWSRDGQTIYFMSERERARGVYVMNVDGSNVRKVADGNVVRDANVSPDGRYFAYTNEVNSRQGLYVYDLRSGTERLLIGGNGQ